jgi:ABC-2 type transport system permease protein
VTIYWTADTRPITSTTSSRTIAVVVALVRRDLGEGRVLRTSVALDVVYGVVNLLVFLFISRVLHHTGQQGLGTSATYFDFVAVGIAFMVVAQVACTQLVSRVQEEQRTGTLEMLAATSVSRSAVAAGLAAYPMLLGLARSSLYLVAACLLLGVESGSADWLGVAAVLLLGAVAAAALGVWVASFAVAFSHGQAASRAFVVALGFLSGAYFPIAALPAALEPITTVLPTRIAIDGLRAAVTGGSWLPLAGWLLVAIVVLVPLALLMFSGAIARSIRKGTLARG